jgi:hypothetical protein
MVRCKFKCHEVTKRVGWGGNPFVYAAKLTVVTDQTSEENKAFFAATPSGSLEVGTVKQDVFEVGREYYVDLTPVES